ncbi:unnamed protein product [Absidia cylindrospora]
MDTNDLLDTRLRSLKISQSLVLLVISFASSSSVSTIFGPFSLLPVEYRLSLNDVSETWIGRLLPIVLIELLAHYSLPTENS